MQVQYDGVRDMLWGHCVAVLDIIPSSLPALTAVAYLTLLDVIKSKHLCTEQALCSLFRNTLRHHA